MFDFGFRPWGDVIGDVGNQVKEQINRYHQNRLQEQLLSRQDNLRNQEWGREDLIRNQGYARQDSMMAQQRAQQLEDLGRPANQDISSMMAELLGSTPKHGLVSPGLSESFASWGGSEPTLPMTAPPQYNQRDINQLGQLAPFVRADKYGTGIQGNGLTFEQRKALQDSDNAAKGERNTLNNTTRKEEGGANRSVKRDISGDQIELGYARIRALLEMREKMIAAGAANAELNALNDQLVAEIGAQKAQTSSNVQIVGGTKQDAIVGGNAEAIKDTKTKRDSYMRPPGAVVGPKAPAPGAKKVETKTKKESAPPGFTRMFFPDGKGGGKVKPVPNNRVQYAIDTYGAQEE